MFSTAQLFHIIFTFHFIFYYAKGTEILSGLHREKRQLLFPNTTLLQFNVGIGTPSPAALINFNWAIQANFQLPWNRTQIPIDILEANSGYTGPSRKKRADEEMDYENDSRLYHFYKYIEGVLNTFSYNGTDCMLRVLCQVGAEPLEVDDEEDLLHELVGYALNPKNDLEHTAYKEEINPYVEAFENGKALQDCVAIYKSCSLSLVDLFSKRYNMP